WGCSEAAQRDPTDGIRASSSEWGHSRRCSDSHLRSCSTSTRPRGRMTRSRGRRARRLTLVASGSYFRAMRAVGLKTLKNRLSEYVRAAAGGETVLVTDRDRVVAELGPPREGRSPLLADARLAEAVRHGWITPPAVPGA